MNILEGFMGKPKDPRDRARFFHKKAGTRIRSTPIAGRNGMVSGVRTEKDRNQEAQVTEERYNLPRPAALKGLIRELFAKINVCTPVSRMEHEKDVPYLRSRVLVLIFREPMNGITGIASCHPAEERRLRKCGFTHVALERRVSDMSQWRLSFFKPRSGNMHGHAKHGEAVAVIEDRWQILEWFVANGLTPLFDDVPALLLAGFLPERPADTERRVVMETLDHLCRMLIERILTLEPQLRTMNETSVIQA